MVVYFSKRAEDQLLARNSFHAVGPEERHDLRTGGYKVRFQNLRTSQGTNGFYAFEWYRMKRLIIIIILDV